MKTNLFKSALFLGLLTITVFNLQAQQRCGTLQLLENNFKRNPSLRAIFEKNQLQFRQLVQQRLANKQNLKELAGPVITIPIVFHIVMQNPSSVTDAQVLAQLDTLNKDYAGLNGDSVRIPAYFKSLFGKSGINFCLAKRTPEDEPTSGIVRYTTAKTSFSNSDNELVKHAASGGADAWNTDKYLNIWICNLENDLLGYGTFPGSTAANEQGVVIDFGSIPGGSLSGYNKGKTLTHEAGHYFNLNHTWGDDGGDCSGSDGIADTPNQGNSTSGCPTGVQTDNCSTVFPGILYQDYMDYSSDDCLILFTPMQMTAMETAISSYRFSLLTSNGCTSVNLQNYDAQPRLINTPASRLCDPVFTPTVTIYNKGSVTLTSLTIKSEIDNGDIITTNWTGSLPSLLSTEVSLSSMTTPTGNHILTVITTAPNGIADQNTNNDTLHYSIMYYPPTTAPLSESFEGNTFPPAGWDIVNEDGLITWRKNIGFAKTGNSSVYKDNYNDTYVDQKDYLRLPTVNIANTDSAFISFQVAAAVQNSPDLDNVVWDTLQVMISTDCGKTYTSIYKKWGADLITKTGPTGSEFFPAPNQWRKDSIDISAYIPKGDVLLAFVNTAELENNIFIDDVNVRTAIVNPNLKAKGFLLTPNPTSGQVTVQFYPQPNDLKGIVIFSSIGQKVAETVIKTGEANNYYTYDLSHFAPGVYIVRSIFTDRTITKKIVLVR